MKTRKDYKPRKILFIVNTTDKKRAKKLWKIENGDEYSWYDVEVYKWFDTPRQCFDFMYMCWYWDVYNLYCNWKLVQTDETENPKYDF